MYGIEREQFTSSDADSDDSKDTEEDSDGEELTPAVDAAILRTLARIRKKDPVIYESGRRVFEEEHTLTQEKAPVMKPKMKEKSKSLTIRESTLASALAGADTDSRSPSPQPLTHTDEQARLLLETRAAFHGAIDSEAEDVGVDNLLIPRSRTRDEIELDDEEYKTFLEREVGEDLHSLVRTDADKIDGSSENIEIVGEDNKKPEDIKKRKGQREREKERRSSQGKDEVQGKRALKERNKKSKEEADQEFLMNYIFNRGWIDRSNRRVPTYNEIVGSSSKKPRQKSDFGVDQNPDDEREGQGAAFSDEDAFDDLVDAFETSYNFRFEEPAGALISSFPRDLPSARRESTTRKNARSRKKGRHQAEKQALLEARREEIKRARALVEAAGCTALAHLDLDADWDPSKHDARMAELYGGDDIVDSDEQEPVWDDDINIDNINPCTNARSKAELKKQKKKKKKKKADESEDVGVDEDEMDADLGAGTDWDDGGEEWRGTEEERKRKMDAYMDEVVNRLGFSDITSHMPTRFHYTSVAPESYGLAPAEILLAADTELNSYVGLKKLAPYCVDRAKAKRNWDPKRVQRLKEFRKNLHSRVSSHYEGSWSLGANATNRASEAHGGQKKRKGKKERAKLKATQGEKDDQGDDAGALQETAAKSQKQTCDPDISPYSLLDERNGEDDMPKKKRRRRHKRGSGGGGETESVAVS